nr:efflux RND transporter permease subunit [Acidobacteriota bacterium]
MTISDFAIRRPVITVVTMLALVVFGLVSLTQLQTDEFPDVAVPVVVVSVPYPGASPDSVEREIIDPLEEAFTAISGVKRVKSNALDSFGVVMVEFQYEKDLQEATQDIRDKINSIRNDLPEEMKEPILTKINPNDTPIVSLALSSETVPVEQLTLLADPGITRQLRAITGVGEVEIAGEHAREMTIDLRPDAMQASGISVGEVVAALQSQNLAVPVGQLLGKFDERTIRLRGRLETAEDFTQLIVAERGGRVIRLGDVATAHVGIAETRTGAYYSGLESVGIDVKKSKGYSTTAVADVVKAEVEKLRATLPAGVELKLVRDAGERVRNSVANVQSAIIEGAALTVLTVFLFLNSWRSTVITGLALPVSVIASFIAVLAFGFTLNTMSLLGLSLSIGILIDDAIVVRENIVRHIEMGKDHYTASREGTSEIALAVAATTFSIIVVFVPIGFMGGIAQQWFAPFALTIACSVLVSLFVSFSLDPMLSAYWPDPHIAMEKRSFISRGLNRFNIWFDGLANTYKRIIGWALRHRLAMVTLAIASFVGAIAMPTLGYLGGSFFPVQDVSEFIINIETPPGSNLDYTEKRIEEVASLARKQSEVSYTYATVGGPTGAVDEGSIYVRLTPKATRERHQEVIASELREAIKGMGGVTASIASGRMDNLKQIQIQIRGTDPVDLARIADKVLGIVRGVPGAVDVGLSSRGQKPELDVKV